MSVGLNHRSEQELRSEKIRLLWLGSSIAGASLLLTALLCLNAPLNHDEHQFVASGAELSRHGLLPYRDFGYFHLPNLVFVYAALFRFSSQLLLSARLFSAFCGSLTVLTVTGMVYRVFRSFGPTEASIAVLSAAALLLGNPLFVATSGRAWNHDLSSLLALWSFGVLLYARQRVPRLAIVAGVLAGLSIGTRLTFAPMVAALIAMVWFAPDRRTHRGRCMLLLIAGIMIGLLPTLWLLILSPPQFVFGNWTYPRLNTAFRIAGHYKHAMGFYSKAVYPFGLIRRNPLLLPLFSLLILCIWFAWSVGHWREHPHRGELSAVVMVLTTLLVGSFAPSPLFPVYFYVHIPFLVLLAAYLIADARLEAGRRLALRRAGMALGVATLGISLGTVKEYRGWHALVTPSDSIPGQTHCIGMQLRAMSESGRVLTCAPIFPLEGGLEIYPQQTTGPFSARAADQITSAAASRYRVMGVSQCVTEIEKGGPTAIFTGKERSFDAPIEVAARRAGYVVSPIGGTHCRLYTRPAPRGPSPSKDH